MSTPSAIIVALWVIFYSFWLISATRVEKAARSTSSWQGIGIRVLLVITAVVLIRLLRMRHPLVAHASSPTLIVVGFAMCIAGLMFAVWARLH